MLQITILLCYLGGAALLGAHSYGRREIELAKSVAPAGLLTLTGLLIHSVALIRAMLPEAGLNLSLANTTSLLAWQITVMALLMIFKPPLRGLAALLLPFAAAGALLTGFGTPARLVTATLTWELQAHILLAAAAYTLLTIGAALAVLILLQDKRLRQHRPSGWLRILPPLETMEGALFGTLGSGFGLLTLAVFSGLIFVDDLLAQHLAHKTVLSLLAWLIFGILLLGRWRFGWRGKKTAFLTLVGFAVLVLAYYGSRIILHLLDRQWG